MTFPLPERGFYLVPRIYLQELHTSNTSQSYTQSLHIMHLLRSAFLNASAPTVEATQASFQPFEAVLLHRARQKFMYFMLYIRVVIVQNF